MSIINTYNGNGALLSQHTVRDADYALFVERLEQDIDVARITVYKGKRRVAVIACK